MMRLLRILWFCLFPVFVSVALADKASFQAFLEAVKVNDLAKVSVGLKNGEDPNQPDAHGYNAFHYAAFWGNTDVIDLFLRGNHVENINARGHYGLTALHLAAGGGREDAVARLLQEAALVVDSRTNPTDGIVPYHMAMGLERAGVRERLLADPREQVNPAEDQDHYGLHRAARRVYTYGVERILAYPDDDLSDREWAELFYAYERANDERALAVLREAGLEPEPEAEFEEDGDDSSEEDVLQLIDLGVYLSPSMFPSAVWGSAIH